VNINGKLEAITHSLAKKMERDKSRKSPKHSRSPKFINEKLPEVRRNLR
jgi:hypothetical protein